MIFYTIHVKAKQAHSVKLKWIDLYILNYEKSPNKTSQEKRRERVENYREKRLENKEYKSLK